MESALTIANYFIKKGIEENNPVTPMKAIKLAYISHGWCLAFDRGPLFDEPVIAWKYGPVIRSIYDALKGYGKQPILSIIDRPGVKEQPTKNLDLLSAVWDAYGALNGLELSSLTHAIDTPWNKTYSPLNESNEISINLIQEHYKEKRNSKNPLIG